MIRFQRVGRRNQASFRLVVLPKTAGAHGKPLEYLGSWNPKTKATSLKKERILYWLGQGAKTSATVNNLLVKNGVIQGEKIPVDKKAKEERAKEPAVDAGEAPAPESKEADQAPQP